MKNNAYDFPDVRKNFIQMLDNVSGLPTDFEADLVRARYGSRAVEAARKRNIENPHIPAFPLAAFAAARRAIEKGFDIAVVVGPEGFAYEPYFEDLGIPTVAVNIPESRPNEPRSFTALDDLTVLQGKRVLVVEDDVRTGATLQTILDKVKSYAPGQFGLYLGQPASFQEQKNIPSEFQDTYIANADLPEQEGLDFENHLKSIGLKIFKTARPE